MSRKTRILLLEDNKYHALLIKRELADKFPQVVLAGFQSAEFARDELLRNIYEIVLIDWEMATYDYFFNDLGNEERKDEN